MKRVMIDQGSGAEIMYHSLFRGLGLKLEDLSNYDVLLVEFDGKVTVTKGYDPVMCIDRGEGGECEFHNG